MFKLSKGTKAILFFAALVLLIWLILKMTRYLILLAILAAVGYFAYKYVKKKDILK